MSPPLVHPQVFPRPSWIAPHYPKVYKLYDEHVLGEKQLVPLKAHVLRYAAHVTDEGFVIVSVHALFLQVVPPVTQPQATPLLAVVKIQRSKVLNENEEQVAVVKQLVPL